MAQGTHTQEQGQQQATARRSRKPSVGTVTDGVRAAQQWKPLGAYERRNAGRNGDVRHPRICTGDAAENWMHGATEGRRPRRWLRLAIALSLAWAIVAGIWAYTQTADYAPKWEPYNKICAHRSAEASRPTPAEYVRCTNLRTELEAKILKERLLFADTVVAVPIAVGSLLLWLWPWVRGRFPR